MGAVSLQTRLCLSACLRSVSQTDLSLPALNTWLKLSVVCSAHTPSSWQLNVAMHLCWPSDHSRMVPSLWPTASVSPSPPPFAAAARPSECEKRARGPNAEKIRDGGGGGEA